MWSSPCWVCSSLRFKLLNTNLICTVTISADGLAYNLRYYYAYIYRYWNWVLSILYSKHERRTLGSLYVITSWKPSTVFNLKVQIKAISLQLYLLQLIKLCFYFTSLVLTQTDCTKIVVLRRRYMGL